MTEPDVRTSEEIVADIRSQLSSGRWPVGTRLLEDGLVLRYGCARETVRRAMRVLCEDGAMVEFRAPATAVPPQDRAQIVPGRADYPVVWTTPGPEPDGSGSG
jgi:DNA-binding GntR family transcriptional regulator